MVDAKSFLLGEIHESANHLAQISKVLDEQPLIGPVQKQVAIRLQTEIKKKRNAFRSLEQDLTTGGVPLDVVWSKFQLDRRDCKPLLAESLALLQGALTRKAALDEGMCAIADAMLRDLSVQTDISWPRFTIVATDEFYAEISGVIRLRYPEVGIWNLPVAAHEFGHYLSRRIPNDPFGQMLALESKRGQSIEPLLNEHFADLFATFALGPAFAFNAILLRFNPLTAMTRGVAHPSDIERTWWILETLRRMSVDEGAGPRYYDDVIDDLEKSWSEAVKAAAGQSSALPAEAKDRLEGWLDEVYQIISTELPGVRYKGWLQAQGLAKTMADGKKSLANGITIPDVVNAAWFSRAYLCPDIFATVGEQAAEMCREISRMKEVHGA